VLPRRAEVFWIAGDFDQGLGAGAEQQTLDGLLVLQGQWRQQMRQREDNVDVARRKKFLPAVSQPTLTSVALTDQKRRRIGLLIPG